NQHHHADGAHEQEQGRTKASADVVRQEHKLWLEIVALGMLTPDLFCQDGQFGLGVSHGNTRFQASHDRKGIAPTIGFGGQRKWEIEVDAAAGSKNRTEVEGIGKHTNYRNGRIVESEWLAYNGRIGAKSSLPEALTQQDSF